MAPAELPKGSAANRRPRLPTCIRAHTKGRDNVDAVNCVGGYVLRCEFSSWAWLGICILWPLSQIIN